MLSIHPFSIAVACGALAAVALFMLLGRHKGAEARTVELFALLALPLGVLCGHLLYFIAMVHVMVPDHGVLFALRTWQGGFMFYGAVGGTVLAAWIASRVSGERLSRMLDWAALSLLLLIAVIRFAEPLDGQGWGMDPAEAVKGAKWLQRFPFSFATDPEWPEFTNLSVCYLAGLWALIALAISLAGLRRRAPGQTATLALVLYAGGQILLESLRRDYAVRWRFVRVSQLISALLLLAVLIAAVRQGHLRGWRAARYIGGLFLCVGAVIALEFAVDKPLKLPGHDPIYFSYVQVYSGIALMAVCMGLLAWFGHKPSRRRLAEVRK